MESLWIPSVVQEPHLEVFSLFFFPLARMQTLVGMNQSHHDKAGVEDGQGIEGCLAFLASPTTYQGLHPFAPNIIWSFEDQNHLL